MTQIIITSSSPTATEIRNSEVTQSIPPLEISKSGSVRLIKVIVSNVTGGNYAILFNCIEPSILNSVYIPTLGVFCCPNTEKAFECDSFESVQLSAKRLSSLRLSLFDVDKGVPAEPLKGRSVKVLYVLQVCE